MRASLYLIGFAAASIVGAGAVEIGCSSSSSTAPPASGDASMEGGGGSSSGGDDTGAPDTGTTCTPVSDASAATIMTGSSSWDCEEVQCPTELKACAADCECNNDVLTALQCLVPDASAGATSTCFGPILASSNPPDVTVLTCLSTHQSMCMGGGDAGDAGHPDSGPAPSDAGDGGG